MAWVRWGYGKKRRSDMGEGRAWLDGCGLWSYGKKRSDVVISGIQVRCRRGQWVCLGGVVELWQEEV